MMPPTLSRTAPSGSLNRGPSGQNRNGVHSSPPRRISNRRTSLGGDGIGQAIGGAAIGFIRIRTLFFQSRRPVSVMAGCWKSMSTAVRGTRKPGPEQGARQSQSCERRTSRIPSNCRDDVRSLRKRIPCTRRLVTSSPYSIRELVLPPHAPVGARTYTPATHVETEIIALWRVPLDGLGIPRCSPRRTRRRGLGGVLIRISNVDTAWCI